MAENFQWTRPPSQAWDTQMYLNRLLQAGYIELLKSAAQIEGDMKREAIWHDWTGDARKTLSAFVLINGEEIVLIAKQQMSYGVSLELGHGGKYAIVMPTLQRYYGQVMGKMRGMVGDRTL